MADDEGKVVWSRAERVMGVLLGIACFTLIALDIAAALFRPTYWRCPGGNLVDGWHCERVKPGETM